MISSSEISAFGLLLDIIGAILLWRFGLPPDVRRGGHSYLLLEEKDESENKKASIYDKISHVAIFLIVLGFVFQAVGTLLPSSAFVSIQASSQASSDATTPHATASKPAPAQKQ